MNQSDDPTPPPLSYVPAPSVAPSTSTSSGNRETILKSNYDSEHPLNKRSVASSDREENMRWTETERAKAAQAVEPSSMEELQGLVRLLPTVFNLISYGIPTAARHVQ